MGVVGQLRSHLWLVNGDDLRGVKSPAPPLELRAYCSPELCATECRRGETRG